MINIPKTMKAMLLTEYNKLELQEIPVPKPGRHEVLCKIKAVAICGTDPKIFRGERPGEWPQKFPHILGHEWSGLVVALGEDVASLKVGDRVAGEAHCGCGMCKNCLAGNYTICLNYGKLNTGARHLGFNYNGANCEYNAYPIKTLHKIPDTLSYQHACLVDISGVALHCIELVGVTPGGTVAIYGPGPAGICTMQIVKGLGASKVIMVGRKSRLQWAKECGSDYVVDFSETDPVKAIRELTNGYGADEAYECSGAPEAPSQCVDSLKRGGRVGLIGLFHSPDLRFPNLVKLIDNEISIIGSRANPNVSDKVIELLDRRVINPDTLITHTFPLERYPEALDVFINRKGNSIKVIIEP